MTKRINGTGSVQELASGRYRARYVAPDGKRRSKTLPTKTAAIEFLASVQPDIGRQEWRPPEPGRETVGEYVRRWILTRPVKDSTRALYAHLHRLWIHPYLDTVPLAKLDPATVRAWHGEISTKTGPTRVAQSYRLLAPP